MNRLTGLVLAFAVGMVLLPATAHAQKRPSDNKWTRSAKQYLQRAEKTESADERRALYEQALQQLTEAFQKDADNAMVWLLAGQTYIKLDDFVKADSALTKAQELYPQYELLFIDREREGAWVEAYNASVRALQENRIDDAIALLQKADAIYRERPEARLQLASLHIYKQDYESAARALEGTLEILRGPASQGLNDQVRAEWKGLEDEAMFMLAQVREQLGGNDEAIQIYRDLVARNPQNLLQVKTRLAVLLMKQGNTAEGSASLSEVLADSALSDQTALSIGVELYQGEQYELAATALRKAIEGNPYSRDGFIVLADALYRQATKLEEQKKEVAAKASPGADAKELTDRLKALYQEMAEAAAKAREFEPNGEDAIILLGSAYRGLGAIEADAKASQEWKRKAVAEFQRLDALPFGVTNIRFNLGEEEVSLSGEVKNLKLKEGEPVKLRVTFVEKSGGIAGSQDVTVSAPAAQSTVPFEVRLPVQAGTEIKGWKYEVVS